MPEGHVPAAVCPVRTMSLPRQEPCVGSGSGGGVLVHCVWLHAQLEQLRPDGPSHVPGRHRPLLWQKPQPVAPVQPPHAVKDEHAPHLLVGPNCHAAHACPDEGPDADPGSHLFVDGHHPQPLTAAHVEHVVWALHEVWAAHCAVPQRQSAQAPTAGPKKDPYAHPAATPGDPPHHPHPVAAAHEEQPPYWVHEVGCGGLGMVPSAGTTTGKETTLLL